MTEQRVTCPSAGENIVYSDSKVADGTLCSLFRRIIEETYLHVAEMCEKVYGEQRVLQIYFLVSNFNQETEIVYVL